MTARTATAARLRPWRVTRDGGRVVSTFSTQPNALERAKKLLALDRYTALRVRHRDTQSFIELTSQPGGTIMTTATHPQIIVPFVDRPVIDTRAGAP